MVAFLLFIKPVAEKLFCQVRKLLIYEVYDKIINIYLVMD